MNLGPKKKAELVERAKKDYDNRALMTHTEAITSVVTLVLSECEARVAPLVVALERDAVVFEITNQPVNRERVLGVLAAYRASLADEPEPKPTLAEAVEAYLRTWPEHGDALKDMREALAREREKRS